jgi:hypothetical protein
MPKWMRTLQTAIIVNIHPIQTERNDKGPDSSHEAYVKANGSWAPNDNLIEIFSQNNDIESSKAINLMRNINSSAIPNP